MSSAVQAQPMRVNINSGEELVRALRHTDLKIRTMILRAIREKPAEAMAYGKIDGRDLIDELLLLCESTQGADRLGYVYTVLSLNDPRGVELARGEFVRTDNSQIALLAASRLAGLPAAERVSLLAPVVMGTGRRIRSRAAANLLADCDELEPRVALRVALLADHAVALPPVNADTLEVWLAELQGPYPRKARKTLLQCGRAALERLLALWERLPEDVALWALSQGLEKDVPGNAGRVRETIRRDRRKKLLQAALKALPATSPEDGDEALLAPLASHEDPEIRAAAILAGAGPFDGAAELSMESSNEVRLAIIKRMSLAGGADEVEALIPLLGDENWKIRARAADALVALAPASLQPLHRTLGSDLENARLAAAQALYRLGKEEWLRDSLTC